MKRRLVKIACFLLLGVVLTYLVAWGVTYQATWRGTWSSPSGTPSASIAWLWPAPAHWSRPNEQWRSVSLGGEYVEAAYADTLRPEYSLRVSQQVQRRRRVGWPLLALESRQNFEVQQSAGIAVAWSPLFVTKHVWLNSAEQGVHITGNAKFGQVNLPLLPRCPYFGASVLLYAAAAWGVFWFPAHLRRRVRRRRNRCERCAYELSGLAACPKCGQRTEKP